ncbi:FUN14 domain-containing protein [Haloplanus sp. GCM10025708]|uniref:FUN14 domain-containing protein n=1 Tax=Haloferacaceae TaxID=1644056 RepID=UPI0036106250
MDVTALSMAWAQLQLGLLQIDLQQLGLEFGSGAVIGGVIGFAAKKVAKIIALLVGLELALFKFLESRGILTVDWGRLTAGFVESGQSAAGGAPPDWAMTVLSTLSISTGFAGGFFLGFRKG